jgi:hypothetical protein
MAETCKGRRHECQRTIANQGWGAIELDVLFLAMVTKAHQGGLEALQKLAGKYLNGKQASVKL